MLKNAPVTTTFSVNSMSEAKIFFSETLGIDTDESIPGMLTLKLSGGNVMLYEMKNHKPASYTLLNFAVDDIEKAMDELKAKGVKFIKYKPSEIAEKNTDNLKVNENGLADFGDFKIAFFNDPAGNNHAIMQM